MKKVIQFDMPAGALFGKFRHLGGGRFEYNPEVGPASPLASEFPAVFDGWFVESEAGDCTHFRADIVDAPEGQARRVVHFADFYVGDEIIGTGEKISEQAMMALASLAGVADGMEPEWREASEAPPIANWYEVESKEPRNHPAHDFWDGQGWLVGNKIGVRRRWRQINANRVWRRVSAGGDK